MTNFFSKFDNDQQFNLLIGDFLNKLAGYPTRDNITEAILSEIGQPSRNYIHHQDSLAEVIQAYLDDVINTKQHLLKEIKGNYSIKFNTNLEKYQNILTSKYFANIFSLNFDNLLENNFSTLLSFIKPSDEEIKYVKGQKSIFKIFGNLNSINQAFISSQDIRRLKLLPIYKKFFKELRNQFTKYPTIFLSINFDNRDIYDIIDFILKDLDSHEGIYIITNNSIISNKTLEIINKYNLKIIPNTSEEFIDYFNLKEIEVGRSDLQKKFMW